MALTLYNYLTRKKDEFRPLEKGRVGLYTCGPTVYNVAHIGNFRTYLFEDVLRRTLELFRYRVKHVMNLTDVDDKTIRDSVRAGKTLKVFTDFYAKEFFRDIKALNISPATKYPRATGHIREMVRLIQTLLKKGAAYKTEDGVYFSIKTFKNYGKLSGIARRTLKPGARISTDEYAKEDANDFALWKFKKPDEPSWKAPFGEGRPGWHIECSAMSMKHLGETFDIHAGAVDLIFPHHEDEIAQSEAATGKPFAIFFIEGEHLLVDSKKMSKSLGNVFTLRDIEAKGFHPLDFRYFALGAHYRTQLNFTREALAAARSARRNIRETVIGLKVCKGNASLKEENEALKVVAYLKRQFTAALADDLNTPKALAVLNKLTHYGNSLLAMNRCAGRSSKVILALIKEFDRALGLKLLDAKPLAIPAAIQKIGRDRERARKEKNWIEADRLRDEIKKAGFLVEDSPTGPQLKAR